MDAETERVLLALESAAAQKKRRTCTPTGPCDSSEPANVVATPLVGTPHTTPTPSPPPPRLANALEFPGVYELLVGACKLVLDETVFKFFGGVSFVSRSSLDCVRIMLLHDEAIISLLADSTFVTTEAASCGFFAVLACVGVNLSKAFVSRPHPNDIDTNSVRDLTRATSLMASLIGKQTQHPQKNADEAAALEELVKAARAAHRITARNELPADVEAVFKRCHGAVANSQILNIVATGAILTSSKLFGQT